LGILADGFNGSYWENVCLEMERVEKFRQAITSTFGISGSGSQWVM
jgi:hypothetical protein